MASPADIVFSPAIKAAQERLGSRAHFTRRQAAGWMPDTITPDLAAFIADQRSVFLATASADGQPTIQHRGGPRGFLKVLDERTIAFADYAGNRQYITLGNLSENDRIHLFLIDYAARRRIKIWGRARVAEDAAMAAALMPAEYRAKPERAILITVTAWDSNCAQHIPQRFDAEDVVAALAERDARIAALEEELARLRIPA